MICLHFNWGGRRRICLEQSGSTPFPSDLQELLQGVRAVQLWVLQCVVLEESWQTWSHSGYFSPFSFFFFFFFSVCFMSALSPPCTLWWTQSHQEPGMLESYHSAVTRSCGTAEILSPERIWTPLITSGLCCALTSSHRWFTPLVNSLPAVKWLLQIHPQPIHIFCPFGFTHTNACPLIGILILLPLFSLPFLSSDFNVLNKNFNS